MTKAKKQEATLEVRFVGPGVSPDRVPLRAVSDALAAVQDIASGRDPSETRHVPQEKGIGLVEVRPGSAVYSCVAREPEAARKNLSIVGRLVEHPENGEADGDILIAALRPIEALSQVAKSIGCRVEVDAINGRRKRLLSIDHGAFERVSKRLFLRGDTTVVGQVQRVGGITGMRCTMRVPGRRHALYCDVETREVARQLGQHLYEQIAASGTAVWIHRTWAIYEFTIRAFTQPQLGDPKEAIKKLRKAGLRAWDQIPDPEAYIQELRP